MHFAGNDVGRILVDNGSSTDVLTWQCFVKMGFTEKNLHKSQYSLIGFGGKKIEALGKIELNVTSCEGNTQRTKLITFDVVDIAYPYNVIFGRNSIIKFAAVINQAFLCMKIPTAGGVIMILGNQEEARRCKDNAACAMKMYTQLMPTTITAKMRKRSHSALSSTRKTELCRRSTPKKFCSAKMSQIEQ